MFSLVLQAALTISVTGHMTGVQFGSTDCPDSLHYWSHDMFNLVVQAAQTVSVAGHIKGVQSGSTGCSDSLPLLVT